MKVENQYIDETGAGVCLDENTACDACGRFGAFRFGERTLCQECYEGCGSCCPEFGKDDLWTFPNED
jgi:hypothetical protein